MASSFSTHQRGKNRLNHGLDSEASSFLSIGMPPHSVAYDQQPECVSRSREGPLQSENTVFLSFPHKPHIQSNGGIEREIGRKCATRESDCVVQREQSVLYLAIGKRYVCALQ